MANLFNPDFREFLEALNNNQVDYILIGGYAVILHGYSRTTGDMDIWVRKTTLNYQNLENAFHEFKMPVFDMTLENFLHNDEVDVFSFGVLPARIDLMTAVKELNFAESFANSSISEIDGISIRLIGKADLIRLKKAVNRPKDQNDIYHLNKG